ncbi:P22-like antirepressor protein [Volucribacter psittacicida]|uniref:P22-like antirepressor protein n=1 Tax=Volucribacter psittacicida TaxID=203482 RepID=A0A4R1FMC0_9PAST|nr:phage antirepressor N-terminal domain-containing protein [Volucribacter psittacicida]TCJ96136.1 P22-like antirepressor protein [Volucribacter psittacicida]
MNTQLQTIQFNSQSLVTFEQNGTHYTAMKPICENIGLAWNAQLLRIKRDEVLSKGMIVMITPTNGGEQEMVCLPIQYLNGWLFGIDTNRVKPEIRETLIKYKKECYQALHDYWFKGEAKREINLQKLTKEHQLFLKDLVMDRTKRLPKDKQAKGAIAQWSALKTHFGKSYKDIDDEQFVEAVSLLARLPLEGELIIEQQNTEMIQLPYSIFLGIMKHTRLAKKLGEKTETLHRTLFELLKIDRYTRNDLAAIAYDVRAEFNAVLDVGEKYLREYQIKNGLLEEIKPRVRMIAKY